MRERLLAMKEVAAKVGLSKSTVSALVRDGQFPPPGHAKIQRRHVSPRGWRDVEEEIRTLTLGAVESSSAMHSALVPPGRGVRLSYALGRPIMSGDPGDLAGALDALLSELQSKG